MKVKEQKIRCLRCFSFSLYRFGKEPKTRRQKYRCKICRYQFVEGKTPSKKKDLNLGLCPRCGKRIHLRKRNRNTLQVRCSDRLGCRYSFSYRYKRQFKEFLEGAEGEDFFKLPKHFKYPVSLVYKALKMYLIYKLSLRETKKELDLAYPKAPSPVAILKWVRKSGSLLISLLSSSRFLEIKKAPKVWLVDDSVVKIKDDKFRLFVVLGYTKKVVLSWYLALTKDEEVVKKALELALSFVRLKPSIIVPDFVQAIEEVIKEVFKDEVLHIKVKLFKRKGSFSNNRLNRLERLFSTLKQHFKLRKQPKSFLSAKLQILIIITIYNLSPHNSINKAPLNTIAKIKKIPSYVEGVIKCFV